MHGVGEPFLRVGDERRSAEAAGRKYFSKGVYFIGKAIWGKVGSRRCRFGVGLLARWQRESVLGC